MKKCGYCGRENSEQAIKCAECGSTEFAALTPKPSPTGWERETAWEKIALVENEAEAERLDVELNNQKIPHVMRSYHDSALDGIYQFAQGWGEVEAPNERKEEILSILKDIRAVEE